MAVMLMTACAAGGQGGQPGALPLNALHDGARIPAQLAAAGADPWIMKHGDYYYSVAAAGDDVTLQRAKALSTIAAGQKQVIYSAQGSGTDKVGDFWAPELHYLDGVWYIYVAGERGGDDIHQMYVLSNESADPFTGRWAFVPLAGMDDKFAIDGTVVENETGRYFVWSGWEGYQNVQQNLYIAHLLSPTQVAAEKVLLSRPEFAWETVGDPLVNEGPAAITVGQTVNVAYSASGSWTDSYCLGLLTAAVDADLTKPDSWTKSPQPVLESGQGVIAPGHNSFVTTPGGSTYMIYHSARYPGSGWERAVRYQQVTFTQNGVLQATEPVAGSALAAIPAGDPPRIRALASDAARHSERVQLAPDSRAVGGKALAGFSDFADTAEWDLSVPAGGTYAVYVWVRPAEIVAGTQELALVRVAVNGQEADQDFELPQAQDYQPAVLTFTLPAGVQHVSVSADAPLSPLLISAIEIVPIAP